MVNSPFDVSILEKNRDAAATTSPVEPTLTKTPDLRNDPNYIRVYDKFGRELFIEKEKWRRDVLPGTLKSNWTNPDQLYAVIVSALNDGFFSEVLQAAAQLHRIDPVPSRGTCAYAIALLKCNNLEEAEKVLRSYLQRHGENGSVLTNLAKVYAARKQDRKAEEILWHALEVDPNQDNGLGWYAVMHRERNGEQGWTEALGRVATLATSWRAQIWLARTALEGHDLKKALELYRESLSRCGSDIPADMLIQMSGDLGKHGHLSDSLQLTEPHFKPEFHGLAVGNNLIKAHLDLGQIEEARQLLDKLYVLNRPDWKQTLSFWDTELARARIKGTVVDQTKPLSSAMLCTEGPIWLKSGSPAAQLFALRKEAIGACFLGSSAELHSPSSEVQLQIADSPGRLSRALPLFLAEQVALRTGASVQTLTPWIVEQPGGFVFSGKAWPDEDAVKYARQAQIHNDYVIITHLKTNTEPWSAELRLLRSEDGKFITSLVASFSRSKPEQGIPELASQLISLLAGEGRIRTQAPPPLYEIPLEAHFATYLLRLEQLLAVRSAASQGAGSTTLNGERSILEGNLELCLAYPRNVVTRILLAETVAGMKKVRPDVVSEFKEKLHLLQREKPIADVANAIVQEMFDDALVE